MKNNHYVDYIKSVDLAWLFRMLKYLYCIVEVKFTASILN